MGDRPKIPDRIVADVTEGARRRCCVCFALARRTDVVKGQIAHLDHDRTNNTPDNLAFLCLDHHDEYDTETSVSKRLTEVEVKRYRQQLHAWVATRPAETDAATAAEHSAREGVPLDRYDRRIPVYRATMRFIHAMLKVNRIEQEEFFEFNRATEEAIFLFDADVAAYLAELRMRGLRLRALSLTLEAPERYDSQRVQEQADTAQWFVEQLDEARERFAPFLRIS